MTNDLFKSADVRVKRYMDLGKKSQFTTRSDVSS